MKRCYIAAIAALPLSAYAEAWTGQDKVYHSIGGAVIGAAVTAGTGSVYAGCLAASGVGLAKEIRDARRPARNTASFRDFAVTAIAGCVAARGTSWAVGPGGVVFRMEF